MPVFFALITRALRIIQSGVRGSRIVRPAAAERGPVVARGGPAGPRELRRAIQSYGY